MNNERINLFFILCKGQLTFFLLNLTVEDFANTVLSFASSGHPVQRGWDPPQRTGENLWVCSDGHDALTRLLTLYLFMVSCLKHVSRSWNVHSETCSAGSLAERFVTQLLLDLSVLQCMNSHITCSREKKNVLPTYTIMPQICPGFYMWWEHPFTWSYTQNQSRGCILFRERFLGLTYFSRLT